MNQTGYAFPVDNEMQLEFENAFGYELTEDQVRSVKEIKEDMENHNQWTVFYVEMLVLVKLK